MNYRYLDAQSREIGPVPLDALHALRLAGSVTDATLARPEEGGPWTPLGALLGQAPASADSQVAPAVEAASAALQAARSALKHLVTNPALGLTDAWKELGPKRAMAAGHAMLSATLLVLLALINSSDSFSLIRPHESGAWIKLVLAGIGSTTIFIAVLYGARRAIGGTVGYECDVFVVGTASLLLTILGLAYTLLGLKNLEALIFLAVAALCIVIVQLFVGLARLGGAREREASLVIPLVIVAGAWGAKIIFAAIY